MSNSRPARAADEAQITRRHWRGPVIAQPVVTLRSSYAESVPLRLCHSHGVVIFGGFVDLVLGLAERIVVGCGVSEGLRGCWGLGGGTSMGWLG
jgi:hypothetical protein